MLQQLTKKFNKNDKEINTCLRIVISVMPEYTGREQ